MLNALATPRDSVGNSYWRPYCRLASIALLGNEPAKDLALQKKSRNLLSQNFWIQWLGIAKVHGFIHELINDHKIITNTLFVQFAKIVLEYLWGGCVIDKRQWSLALINRCNEVRTRAMLEFLLVTHITNKLLCFRDRILMNNDTCVTLMNAKVYPSSVKIGRCSISSCSWMYRENLGGLWLLYQCALTVLLLTWEHHLGSSDW